MQSVLGITSGIIGFLEMERMVICSVTYEATCLNGLRRPSVEIVKVLVIFCHKGVTAYQQGGNKSWWYTVDRNGNPV